MLAASLPVSAGVGGTNRRSQLRRTVVCLLCEQGPLVVQMSLGADSEQSQGRLRFPAL